MNELTHVRYTLLLSVLFLLPVAHGVSAKPQTNGADKPNIILIVTDDQGYNDLSCFGSERIDTPHIDRMANEGVKLTSYYSSAPLCAPSRASLMTGSYSQRVAEPGGNKRYHTILSNNEITIAEVLKRNGYATKAIGKWHLAGSGHHAVAKKNNEYVVKNPSLMPLEQGFDSYFGIPYSNDMNPVVLMRDKKVIEHLGETDKQAGITTRYTDEALKFIRNNSDQPFFLYLAHNMPHTPLYPSEKFKDTSDYGLYGDCVEEIDWNTGRIISTLKELGIDEDTMIVYTSDNGPWIEGEKRQPTNRESRLQSGRADPLRGYKMTTWEGGVRVPCVIRWPGHIPGGRTIDKVVTAMDLMPTFAHAAGTTPPQDRTIDGKNVLPLLTGRSDEGPRDTYYYYKYTHLHGVRKGPWKFVPPRPPNSSDLDWYDRLQEAVDEPTLFNLQKDIGESRNVGDEHPEVLKQMQDLAEQARKNLGDKNKKGRGVRW